MLSKGKRKSIQEEEEERTMTIVAIEGNIGCGKSTMLNRLRHLSVTRFDNRMKVLTEPVEEWEALLERSYNDPSRWCFAINTKVLLSLKDWFPERSPDRRLYVTERSPVSSRFVFADVHSKTGTMDAIECGLLADLYDRLEMWTPDVTVYIRTDPSVCFDRLRQRDRACEKTLSLDYLHQLHDQHESVFVERVAPIKLPDIRIVNGNRHPDLVLNEVLEILGAY
jgi:deoxyadenosine/deoxycytidine kinase